MRSAIGPAIFGLALASGAAFAQQAGDPVGTWLTEDGRAKIRIEHCPEGGQNICGFVAWMKDPLNEKGQPRTDIKNPDPSKRGRPSLGMQLMTDLKPDEDAHYAGEIYNADDGKMYAVTLHSDSATELHVRGCIMHILCGTQTWARVADIALPGTAKLVSTAAAKTAKGTANATKLHDSQAVPAH